MTFRVTVDMVAWLGVGNITSCEAVPMKVDSGR